MFIVFIVLLQTLPSAGASRLLLYSDDDARRFLGCFSCSKYEADSVHNEYGQYGSRYSIHSIWNKYGSYGSPYSTYSACNPYATRPPVVLDEEWAFYGRLTLNSYHPQALKETSIVNWLRFVVCGGS